MTSQRRHSKRRRWHRQAGITVLEATIALSIAGIGLSAAGKGMVSIDKLNRGLGTLNELNERMSTVQALLMSQDYCYNTNLMGIRVASTGSFPRRVATLNEFGTVRDRQVRPLIKRGTNNKLHVDSIEVLQMNPAQGQAPRVTHIELRIRGKINRHQSNEASFDELIPMLAHVNPAQEIDGCGRDYTRDRDEEYICAGMNGRWSEDGGGTCIL